MSESTLQKIGVRVQELRKRQGLSKTDFALMVGISRPYLSKIENGSANVTIKMLERVARGLDVPMVEVLK